MSAKLRVLVVDDVRDMAQTIANDLEAAGHTAEVADSGAAALQRFAERPADVVVKSVDGSKTKAAQILGVDPSTLYRREKRST